MIRSLWMQREIWNECFHWNTKKMPQKAYLSDLKFSREVQWFKKWNCWIIGLYVMENDLIQQPCYQIPRFASLKYFASSTVKNCSSNGFCRPESYTYAAHLWLLQTWHGIWIPNGWWQIICKVLYECTGQMLLSIYVMSQEKVQGSCTLQRRARFWLLHFSHTLLQNRAEITWEVHASWFFKLQRRVWWEHWGKIQGIIEIQVCFAMLESVNFLLIF